MRLDRAHGTEDQQKHWETVYRADPYKFGELPSEAATSAYSLFERAAVAKLLELGSGPGRDTIFFARKGLHVTALDYAQRALESLKKRALEANVVKRIDVHAHDLRRPLPFGADAFDACYSHMTMCMALSETQVLDLSHEICRVLRPKGLSIFTVRSTEDSDYEVGDRTGEISVCDGYGIHFFDEAKLQRLSKGFDTLRVDRIEEGDLPKRLFFVVLQKP